VTLPLAPVPSLREDWRRRRRALEAQSLRMTPFGSRPTPPLGDLLGRIRPAWFGPVGRQGLRNAADLDFAEVTFRFPDLPPAFDGFTILHLSDLHVDTHPLILDRAAAMLAGVRVDAAVITGDFQMLGGRPGPARCAEAAAYLLKGVATRWSRFAILGNHDGHRVADELEAAGISVLLNEHAVLERQMQRLVLVGTDDVHRFYTPAALAALAAGPRGFRVALVHSPDAAGLAMEAGIRLYLCGHTHGGQICLPGGRPVITATDRHPDLAMGAWRLGPMQGYTSRGTGVGTPPLRFFSRGEVALLTLRRGGPAEDESGQA
jgi:predicted MPP superfamily phosphohydrolase